MINNIRDIPIKHKYEFIYRLGDKYEIVTFYVKAGSEQVFYQFNDSRLFPITVAPGDTLASALNGFIGQYGGTFEGRI